MDCCPIRRLGLRICSRFRVAASRDTTCIHEPLVDCENLSNGDDIYEGEASNDAVPTRRQMSRESETLMHAMRRPLPVRNPERTFSMVSFNMLMKGFEDQSDHPGVDADLRSWAWRKPQFVDLLMSFDADLLCMQEVEVSTFHEEFAFLPQAGYSAVEPRDDSKGKIPDLAKCAIFYKTDRFEKLWQDHRSRIVLASFRHRPSGQIVYVGSCHLQGFAWEGPTRFAQVKKALGSLERRMRKDQTEGGVDPSVCSLVLGGDFNETTEGAAVRCLLDGRLPSSFRHPHFPEQEITKQDFRHGFELSDAYAPREGAPSRPPTFCQPPEPGFCSPFFNSIDFVFYSPRSLRPLSVRLPFTTEQLAAAAASGLPADWHCSDHVPVGAVFEFAGLEEADVLEGVTLVQATSQGDVADCTRVSQTPRGASPSQDVPECWC